MEFSSIDLPAHVLANQVWGVSVVKFAPQCRILGMQWAVEVCTCKALLYQIIYLEMPANVC